MFDDPTVRFQIISEEFKSVTSIFEKAGSRTEGLTPGEKFFLLVFVTDNAINSNGIYSLWFNYKGLSTLRLWPISPGKGRSDDSKIPSGGNIAGKK
jgi:hypothetical protein